jgi:hypothetical protein
MSVRALQVTCARFKVVQEVQRSCSRSKERAGALKSLRALQRACGRSKERAGAPKSVWALQVTCARFKAVQEVQRA